MKARAFTLVELLVVVAIIVVLLAILLPSMSKAIYQATLATCGARQRAVAVTVVTYAMDNKRVYPDRGIRSRAAENQLSFLSVMALAHPAFQYDHRPQLKNVLDATKYLQCPFSDVGIDLVNTDPDVSVEASYAMFWGWAYRHQGGAQAYKNTEMYKVGDRWSWQEGTNRRSSYSVLIGDIDLRYQYESVQSSHPDHPSKMYMVQAVDDVIFGFRSRVSRWLLRELGRGELDLNYTHDDGSVQRLDAVIGWNDWDERVDRVPLQYDNHRATDRLQVPEQRAQ